MITKKFDDSYKPEIERCKNLIAELITRGIAFSVSYKNESAQIIDDQHGADEYRYILVTYEEA